MSRASAALLLGSLSGCALGSRPGTASANRTTAVPGFHAAGSPAAGSEALQFAPLRASVDRITRITVCTRPFRAEGPRLDVERIGNQTVVHNYGHGGSGWSLSWGSSSIAVANALGTGEKDIAVVGCGALGLTSATLLQRAGVRVTIYAKDLPPNVRSSWATGLWTPDSRICFEKFATPEFKARWEDMARTSYQTYQTLLGLPGNPVEYIDQYFVSESPHAARRGAEDGDDRPRFAELQRELIADLVPGSTDFGPGSHPFANRYLRRSSLMMFNLTAYSRLLLTDFLGFGGTVRVMEFHSPADLTAIPQRTVINATGYGARQLFGDETLTPVRGQLTRLIPQPEVGYGLFYKGVSLVPRRDGLVIQAVGPNDYYGFDDPTTVPDPAEASMAVDTIASLFT